MSAEVASGNAIEKFTKLEEMVCELGTMSIYSWNYKLSDLEEVLQEAKDAGADVTAFESQKSEFILWALKQRLHRVMKNFRLCGKEYRPEDFKGDLEAAKRAGANVFSIEVESERICKFLEEAQSRRNRITKALGAKAVDESRKRNGFSDVVSSREPTSDSF